MTIQRFIEARIVEELGEHPSRWEEFRLRSQRMILKLHQPDPTGATCTTCVSLHADMDCENEPYPCPTVRTLASCWADHTDMPVTRLR